MGVVRGKGVTHHKGRGVVKETIVINMDHCIVKMLSPTHFNNLYNEALCVTTPTATPTTHVMHVQVQGVNPQYTLFQFPLVPSGMIVI